MNKEIDKILKKNEREQEKVSKKLSTTTIYKRSLLY